MRSAASGGTGSIMDVSVLSSEVRGISPMSGLFDPATVLDQLNAYLDAMVEAIESNDGTIDFFHGACLSATFGAWDDPRDHARRACAAASDMLVRLDALNVERAAAGLLALELGVGVASGSAVVGDVGPSGHRRPSVIGEPAQLAARLEGASSRLGTPVVLSRATASRLDEDQVRSLGWAEIRGVPEPVNVATLAWLAGSSDADS
jgi:adenylate cyclase